VTLTAPPRRPLRARTVAPPPAVPAAVGSPAGVFRAAGSSAAGDSAGPARPVAPSGTVPPTGAASAASVAVLSRPVAGVRSVAVPAVAGPAVASPWRAVVPVPVLARPVPVPVVAAPAAPVRRARPGTWLLAAAGVAAVALLAVQLRDADLPAVVAAMDPAAFLTGLGWYAVSIVAAAYTVTGFTPLPLRMGPTLLAQLAVGGLRLVVPAAAGMPAVIVRYLTRSGATVADAAATVAAGQAAQLLATIVVVAGLGAGSEHLPLPSGPAALVAVGVLAVLAVAGLLVARRSAVVRAGLRATWRGQVTLAAHARRHPGQVAVGLLASAALTLTHVLAFAACVTAAGGSIPLVTAAAIYLGAATAGSLVPTPGGIGPVEAALVAGLTATGLALPVATAAALLSRLVSVWIPAVPGVAALALLRRRALL
jgi:glycosyltransferase 2 family protein